MVGRSAAASIGRVHRVEILLWPCLTFISGIGIGIGFGIGIGIGSMLLVVALVVALALAPALALGRPRDKKTWKHKISKEGNNNETTDRVLLSHHPLQSQQIPPAHLIKLSECCRSCDFGLQWRCVWWWCACRESRIRSEFKQHAVSSAAPRRALGRGIACPVGPKTPRIPTIAFSFGILDGPDSSTMSLTPTTNGHTA